MNTYTAQDANHAIYTIQPGAPFTTYWLNGEPCEINHPWTALDAYSADDLARFDITATPEADPPPAAPASISRMQAQLELHATASPTNPGKTLLDDVNAAVAGASDPTIGIYWNTATAFERQHPKLLAMAQAMGWSSDFVDQLFIAAAEQS